MTELKDHLPFTLFGALTGLALMLLFKNIGQQASYTLFYIFHPAHVILGAMVTASLFKLHVKKANFLLVLIVGYIGAIGIATLSDSVLPFLGEGVLGVSIPLHAETAPNEKDDSSIQDSDAQQKHKIHFGFIEQWYIVNPAAFLGVLIAYFLPRTKFPHAAHILISTWASSTHIMMNLYQPVTALIVVGIVVVLFISVWLPCCISDIVFPVLLVRPNSKGQ